MPFFGIINAMELSEMSVYKFVITTVLFLVAIVCCDEQECNLSRTIGDVIEREERCSVPPMTSEPELSCPIIVRPGVRIFQRLFQKARPFFNRKTECVRDLNKHNLVKLGYGGLV